MGLGTSGVHICMCIRMSCCTVHMSMFLTGEVCALEQLLDGRLLPMDADGATCFSWLRTEIHLTARRPPTAVQDGKRDEEERGVPYQASLEPCPPEAVPASARAAVRDSVEHVPADECTPAQVTGPFSAKLQPDDTIRVSAAPFSALAASRTDPKAVPLQAYEALSLVGAAAGFLLIAWPLSWSDAKAPWARKMASTSTTGGGGFVVATLSSLFLAALLLWLCDWAVQLVASLQRRGPSRACSGLGLAVLSTSSARTSSPIVKTTAVQDVKLVAACAPVATDQLGARAASAGVAEGASSEEERPINGERSLCTSVPVAGRTRPDMGALLRRTPPEARVAVGGPPAMLATVAKELSKAGRAPFVCLTHSM